MMKNSGKRKQDNRDQSPVEVGSPKNKKVKKNTSDEVKVNKDERKQSIPSTENKITRDSKRTSNSKASPILKQSQDKYKTKHKHSVTNKSLGDIKKHEVKHQGHASQVGNTAKETYKKENQVCAALPEGVGSASKDAKTATNLDKHKTPLTARQKHKRFKLRMKRIGKNKMKTTEKLPTCSKETITKVKERIVIPRGPDKATLNWRKLQQEMGKQRETTDSERVKLGKQPLKRRNPKFSKVEAWKTRNKEPTDKGANTDTDKSPEIWFDDVDEIYLEKEKPAQADMPSKGDKAEVNPLVKLGAYKGVTKIAGMDCEMVGVGDGSEDMLARVSIVNQYGEAVYDKFVSPRERVVDYRTFVSGVRPEDLANGEDFMVVQREVADIIKGRILVGHAIQNDLKVLYLDHPRKMIRDTSRYKLFRQLFQGRTPSLKKLTAKVLSVGVQEGEHDSVQDAQAAMRLYTRYRKQWEAEIRQKIRRKPGKVK